MLRPMPTRRTLDHSRVFSSSLVSSPRPGSAACFHKDTALGSRLASVCRMSDRICSGVRTDTLATPSPHHPTRRSGRITAQTLGNTPADSHLWNVRWKVLSSLFGSLFHWRPHPKDDCVEHSTGVFSLESSSPITGSISSQRGASQIVSTSWGHNFSTSTALVTDYPKYHSPTF